LLLLFLFTYIIVQSDKKLKRKIKNKLINNLKTNYIMLFFIKFLKLLM